MCVNLSKSLRGTVVPNKRQCKISSFFSNTWTCSCANCIQLSAPPYKCAYSHCLIYIPYTARDSFSYNITFFFIYDYMYVGVITVKPVFKTTWEIGTPWELRTAASVPGSIHYIEMDLGNKTTSEFRTVFDSPLGIPNSQVPLYILHISTTVTGY